MEASFHEFGTFDFDGEKALEECRSFIGADSQTSGLQPPGRSDLEAFISLFPDPLLAGDLFTIFELGRIRKCLEQAYCGLVRRFYPLLRQAFIQTVDGISGPEQILSGLLVRADLRGPEPRRGGLGRRDRGRLRRRHFGCKPSGSFSRHGRAVFRAGQKAAEPAGGQGVASGPRSAGVHGRIPRLRVAVPRIDWLKKSEGPSRRMG